MMKVNKNSDCPCGSGKIFKKCCANKKKEDRVFEDEFVNFIKSSNAIKLLEFVSYLQLIPENSSKIVRLENIQHKIIENIHDKNTNVKNNYVYFKKIIDKYYAYDRNEDPSESCFSENLMFFNGNNVVFPGLVNNVTEVNQLILNSIFHYQNKISEKCKKEINLSSSFILQTHNKIARNLKIKRLEFVDDYRGKITFPKNEYINQYENLFTFSKKEIEQTVSEKKLELNPISDFTIDYQQVKHLKPDDPEFLKHPFVEYNENYYLALPSCQMYSLNVLLKNKIEEHNETIEFNDVFLKTSKMECNIAFTKMGWKSDSVYQELIDFDVDIWKFDNDKYAIVNYVLGPSDSNDLSKKIATFIKQKGGSNQFIFITILSVFDLEHLQRVSQNHIKNASYQMITGLNDLKRAIAIWELKKLDIWKYLKAKDRAEKRNLNLSPFFSILTYFSYYKKNEDSFFHSDNKTPEFIHFTFDIQGNRVIESLQKEDRHLAPAINGEEGYGYFPVTKYDELRHAPVYLADTVVNGELKLILEIFTFPIWVANQTAYDWESKNFIDAIAYWINEFSPTLKNLFKDVPNIPVTIEISLAKEFNNYTTEDFSKNKDAQVVFEYSINQRLNKISITIPATINNAIKRNNNYGERILMDTILKGLIELFKVNFEINISPDITPDIIDRHMPLSMAKMIIVGDTSEDIKLDNRFISSRIKHLSKADTSIVLEDMINWMGIDIPPSIETREEKISICILGIDTLINKARETLSKFNCIELLRFVILRNEAVLNSMSFKKTRAVTFYECFKNYKDTLKEFFDEDSKNIRTGLSLRCLTEFIVAEPYYSDKVPNDDDVDLLVALIDEIIFLGTTKDLLNFEVDNPEMGRLPSGRLGIKKDYFDKLNAFSIEHKKDEHFEYVESFSTLRKKTKDNENDSYYDKIGLIFDEEFGIDFFKIKGLMDELARYCFEEKSSCLILDENDFIKLLNVEFKLTEREIESFLNHFTLSSRGDINSPPTGYEYPDIFPWRYNRALSYLLRPFIKIKDEKNIYKYIFSPRHLASSSDNFMAVFFDGSLKVKSSLKKINSLLAERNNFKGKHFRNEVYKWMKDYTSLEVVPFEFKIPVKGNEKNFGDVDILAFDKSKKIIYSIECKNTKQAKIIYEFQRDANNYITKQLPKHRERSKWLKDNLIFLGARFKYDFAGFKVESLLISSYQLPIKITQKISDINISSFNEIKRNGYF
ncbi:SEC-C domain-containing protein [Flavobacterium sp. AS60]|uniref:YecA family protein n=1 Tax=Flavobacterium anseongense TaxID=2910677 RepID=UPI001F3CFA9E|nr:SEC-C metal-binding domain-containing protein [Flavobacterium sp. AS60]MCF6129328.1 SEC-C domain-containing protein [Flavobacterium sp. AS60]